MSDFIRAVWKIAHTARLLTRMHEGSAVVEAAGEGVEGFRPGDRVAIEPQVTCGTCYPCSIGRFNVCENLKVLGTHQDGLMCEYVALDAKYLHLCPPDM